LRGSRGDGVLGRAEVGEQSYDSAFITWHDLDAELIEEFLGFRPARVRQMGVVATAAADPIQEREDLSEIWIVDVEPEEQDRTGSNHFLDEFKQDPIGAHASPGRGSPEDESRREVAQTEIVYVHMGEHVEISAGAAKDPEQHIGIGGGENRPPWKCREESGVIGQRVAVAA
jgi:hypothetical protein